jgi:galactokinase
MLESHKSLSSDFEVSCHELDKLVDLAMKCKGVLGEYLEEYKIYISCCAAIH